MSRPLKNATFRQLAAFNALVRLGSVSRAAEELHLTQPAVSIQLGMLEQAAGTPLLRRSARGVKLTDAGELLASYTSRIQDLWREAGEAMATHSREVAGELRVGAVTTAEYLLPPLLLEFVQAHAKVTVKLAVGNRAQIVGQLAAQDIDLAIMGRPPAELKTASARFAKHPMAFVAAPKHPLMRAGTVDLTDVAQANLLVRERGSGTRTTVDALFKEAGVKLRIGSELSSNDAIKQMCAAGFGVAFLSLHACVLELENRLLAILPVTGSPIERDWYVIHLAAHPPGQVAGAFAEFLAQRGQAWITQRLAGLELHLPASAAERALPKAAPQATTA